MQRAVTRLQHNKQVINVTLIAHATEEHVTSAMTSRNNTRDARSVCSFIDQQTLGDQLCDGLQGNESCDATSHALVLPRSYISCLK
jgi:hypothetical protein